HRDGAGVRDAAPPRRGGVERSAAQEDAEDDHGEGADRSAAGRPACPLDQQPRADRGEREGEVGPRVEWLLPESGADTLAVVTDRFAGLHGSGLSGDAAEREWETVRASTDFPVSTVSCSAKVWVHDRVTFDMANIHPLSRRSFRCAACVRPSCWCELRGSWMREPLTSATSLSTDAIGSAVAPRGSRRGSGPVMRWERRYRAAVILSDAIAVIGVAALAGILGLLGTIEGLHPALAPLIAVLVLIFLPVRRAWQIEMLGDGAEEYRRVLSAMFSAAVVLALLGPWLERLDVRPWMLGVLPTMTFLALLARYLLRQWLHRSRRHGRRMLPVVVAGAADSVRELIGRTREHCHVGWRVEAACLVDSDPQAQQDGEIAGVPVIGSLDQLADHVRRGGYRVVAVTPHPHW